MDNLPNIKPFYAVKSNNDPLLLECLASLGTGFDCASQLEMETVLSLGVSPENIVFAQTCKYESHLKYSAENNVSLMTFDSEPELLKISSLYPTARLLVRIKTDSEQSLWNPGDKFGCTVSEAKHLLQVAWDHSLNVVGVSFHVGGGCMEPEGFCTAIVKAHEVFQYAKQRGFNFTYLDVGGGFVGAQVEDDIFVKIAKAMNKTIEEQFKEYQSLTVISEPGTSFSQSCVTIAVRIIGKKSIIDAESQTESSTVYYINDSGLYGNFQYLRFTEKTAQICSALELKSKALYPSVIHGLAATEDEKDKFKSGLLPNMEVGDWLLFLECGNYSTSVCRKPSLSAKVVYYKDNMEVFPRVQVDYAHNKAEANDSLTIHEVTFSHINEFISEQIYEADGKFTPVGFCNLSRIEARYRLWTKYLPNVKPFYAIKSNDDRVILNHLASLGTGFECGTREGIETVLELGVSPVNTIIATTCKPTSHIRYAAERNIYSLMTFDLESELHKIASLHPTAKLLINISPTVNTQDRPGTCDGCSISESPHLLQNARTLGLHVVGVRFSFHVVSGNRHQSVQSYQTAIAMAYQVFQQARTVGFNFNILDIGEGFSGDEEDNDLFIEMAESINKCIKEHFKDYPNLTILAEPGSFFVASCLTIATQIHSKRPVTSDNTTTVFYYINDGVFGSFGRRLSSFGDAVHNPFPMLKPTGSADEVIPCTIWGPTCAIRDKLGSFNLPNLDIGDYLLFNEMGAYSTVASSRFNGLAGDIDIVYFTEK